MSIEEQIMKAFYDLRPDNSSKAIANYLGIGVYKVTQVTTNHFNKIMEEKHINKKTINIGDAVLVFGTSFAVVKEINEEGYVVLDQEGNRYTLQSNELELLK